MNAERNVPIQSSGKTGRRSWTADQKRDILEQAESRSVSAVSKEHGISTALLFRWRTEFMGSRKIEVAQNPRDAFQSDLRDSLLTLRQLEMLVVKTVGKLGAEIQEKRVTSYNASLAIASLVTCSAKLVEMKKDCVANLQSFNPPEEEKAPDNPDNQAVRRAAEKLLLQIVASDKKKPHPDLIQSEASSANGR